MTNGAAAEATAQAIKASGAIVSVESTDFMIILDKVDRPCKKIWISEQL